MSSVSPSITLREIVYNEAGLSYDIPPHAHNLYQWYCVVYGSVDTTIEGRTYTLDSNHSVLIPPGKIRSPRCRDKPPGYLYVLFENHSLALDNLFEKVLITPHELSEDLTHLVRELHQPGENTYELVDALVIRLLIGLARNSQSGAKSGQGSSLNIRSQQAVIEQIEAFMQRNLQRPLSRAELAEVVHLSPTHLARLFRQATGCTLTERWVQFRMASAKQMLLESTLPISEISLQVGYSSFSHFARLFRQQVGVSPGDYRRSQGNVWRTMDV